MQPAARTPRLHRPEAGTDAASDTAKTGTPKDTLVVAIVEDMTSMDGRKPTVQPTGLYRDRCTTIWFTKIRMVPVDPELATEWEWLDDLTLRMKLRDDVYFHNGVQFTAKDVLFMIQKAKTTSISASTYEAFDADNTKIVDDFTIDIKLFHPYAAIFNTFSSGRGGVPCKEYFDQVGAAEAAVKPVGTGPYKFVSWSSGSELCFEANDNYWDKDNMPKTKTCIQGGSGSRQTV